MLGTESRALRAWPVLSPRATPEAPVLVSSAPFRGGNYILTLSTSEKEENVVIHRVSQNGISLPKLWAKFCRNHGQYMHGGIWSEEVSAMQREHGGKRAHPRTRWETWVSLLFGVLFLQVHNCLQPELFCLRQPGFAFPCYEKVTLWNTEGQSWGAAEYTEHLLVSSRSFVRTLRLTEWCGMQCSVHDLLTFDFLPTPHCKGEGRFYEEF